MNWQLEHPVLKAERDRALALTTGDVQCIERLLADDLRYTHATGLTHDRDAYLLYLRNGPRFDTVELSHARVLDLGRGVVATGLLTLKFQRPGDSEVQEARSLVTAVWLGEGDTWRLSVFQSTRENPP